MSMLLNGQNVWITGVLTDDSIAYHIAKAAIRASAKKVLLTNFGERGMSLTRRMAEKLAGELGVGQTIEVQELDVTNPDHYAALAEWIRVNWDGVVHSAVHSVAFAPSSCFVKPGDGPAFPSTEDLQTALNVSAISLVRMAEMVHPFMVAAGSGSIVGLTFGPDQSWPGYAYMSMSKAALESASRVLAMMLGPQGIRCNLIAAGPLKTMAGRGIPGFDQIKDRWNADAPLGWDVEDPSSVASMALVLLGAQSDKMTGQILVVDGGRNIVGAHIPGVVVAASPQDPGDPAES